MLVGIAGNFRKPLAIKLAKRTIALLQKCAVDFVVDSGFLKTAHSKPLKKIVADFFLVFGGDGTMLYAVREMKRQAPVLGINCGKRGHLMQVQPKEMESAVEKALKGKYFIETRARLKIVIDGKRAPEALNEVIIAPKRSFTLFDYSLSIGRNVFDACSDAVAIVTPTGSTAFALAAGGKKIGIGRKVFEILPIHPFSGLKKPFLVNDGKKVSIKLLDRMPCEAIIDGQKRIPVRQKVVVKKSSEQALSAKLR